MGLDMSLTRCDSDNSIEMQVDWRKFNALHNWFVQLTGVGNCKTVEVQHKDLVALNELVKEALIHHKPTLTPVAGFFFGSTEVDECYWEDMITTLQYLDQLLDSVELGTKFYYSANW